jgi:hypothetical protein
MITLTNVEEYSAGAVVLESNSTAAAINPQIDFINGVISWTIQSGNMNGNNFIPGQRSTPISVIVNINTGNWIAGNDSGVLSPTAQTNLKNVLLNMRNAMENFSITNNLVTGTQTPWTSVGV